MTERTKDRLTFVYLCFALLTGAAWFGFLAWVVVTALITGVWP